jgi:GT2 family glycosyltransferase
MIAMITVVCVYNDKKIFASCLMKSLKNQTAKHERIMIDNTCGKFKSAASALNYGGRKASGKYIMFAHQDIVLSSKLALREIEQELDSLPNLGIAGAAGNSGEIRRIATNLTDVHPMQKAGRIPLKRPIKVQTLDECLVAIPRSMFRKLKFDEKVCNDWHLYTVDYALSARKLGFDAYVIPVQAHHMTTSRLTESFYSALHPLLEKHKDAGWIYATTGFWNARIPVGLQRIRLFQLFVIGTSILLNDGVVIFWKDAHALLTRQTGK